MAITKEEHLYKAAQNEAFADNIKLDSDCSIGWAVTVIFYSALHYIEAYFVTYRKGYNNHYSRSSAIQNDPRIRSLYDDYRKLEDLSREARYDAASFNKGDLVSAKEFKENIRQAVEALLK